MAGERVSTSMALPARLDAVDCTREVRGRAIVCGGGGEAGGGVRESRGMWCGMVGGKVLRSARPPRGRRGTE